MKDSKRCGCPDSSFPRRDFLRVGGIDEPARRQLA